jgi:hypothetical protein
LVWPDLIHGGQPQLIELADKAMYGSKESGKNQVTEEKSFEVGTESGTTGIPPD